MEKPNAIATRGLRKETISEGCRRLNGDMDKICSYLHLSKFQTKQYLQKLGIYPIRHNEIWDESLFALAKKEAGYDMDKLPVVDKSKFVIQWKPEVWEKIVACAEEIIKRTESFYPPWK